MNAYINTLSKYTASSKNFPLFLYFYYGMPGNWDDACSVKIGEEECII